MERFCHGINPSSVYGSISLAETGVLAGENHPNVQKYLESNLPDIHWFRSHQVVICYYNKTHGT